VERALTGTISGRADGGAGPQCNPWTFPSYADILPLRSLTTCNVLWQTNRLATLRG